MSHNYNDSEIINGIKKRDGEVLRFLYQNYLPIIQNFIRKNSGSDEDARDIFQEALVVMYEKVTLGQLTLTSQFQTYFYAICRNKWLMVLRKKRKGPLQVNDSESIMEQLPETESDWRKHEQFNLYRKHFDQLSDDCRKVMEMFFKGHLLKDIAIAMGFTEKYAKKRKFLCQKKLISAIENDRDYQELIS